jgi:alanyl-tRNA synthetase
MGQSRELCGGTHAVSTGRLGVLIIVSESSVAAGVRRLEALTGAAALREIQEARQNLKDLAQGLRVKPSELIERVGRLQARVKELEKGGGAPKAGAQSPAALAKSAERIGGTVFLGAKVEAQNPKELRELADNLRSTLGPTAAVALAAASPEGKALLLVAVGPDLIGRLHAGELVAVMAEAVGGRGGGKAELAQAGGPDLSGLDKALALVKAKIESI